MKRRLNILRNIVVLYISVCVCVCLCICINCACTFLCVCSCVGITRYGREVSNTCLTKKENNYCRNCMLEEISPRHFKCNENVSEKRKRGMKPDKI